MSWHDDAIRELRSVLAKLQHLDLWPPWDAAQTIVDAVALALDIMTRPPEPHPDRLAEAADTWRLIGSDLDRAALELDQLRERVTPAVWDGVAAVSFRQSVVRLRTRALTVPRAAREVAQALDTAEAALAAARQRHLDADNQLRQHLSISWGDLWPWELADKLRHIIEAVVHAITEAIAAYCDADAAIATADRAIGRALDDIDLPDHLPTGGQVSAIDAVDAWADSSGPVNGSVLRRYDDAYGALSLADRQAVIDALANAGSATERGWIMAGVAAGLSGAALARYLAHVHGLRPDELRALDPYSVRDGRYAQPDSTTCGSASLVMARMENNPAYALWMLTGYDPLTGQTDPRTPEQRFADEALRMHERTNSPISRDGDAQLPWPSGLGTQPWAVAEEMSATGGSGVPGTHYGVSLVDPADRGAAYDQIVAAAEGGHATPIYVGDDHAPRHVVLVTGTEGDSVTIYDPARGEDVTVTRDQFVRGDVNVAGWDEPWAIVVPD